MSKKSVSEGVANKLSGKGKKRSQDRSKAKIFRRFGVELETIINHINDGVYIVDDKGYFVYVNRTIEKRSGHTFDEFKKIHFLDMVGPKDKKRVKSNVEKILKGGEVGPNTIEYLSSDGKPLYVELHSKAIKKEGKILGFLGISRDISDRKKAEEAVHFENVVLDNRIRKRTTALLRANEKLVSEINERKQAERFTRIQRNLALDLCSTAQLKEGLYHSLDAAIRVSGMDCGGIYLFDETSKAMDLIVHKGLSQGFVASLLHLEEDTPNVKLVMAGRPIYTLRDQLDAAMTESEKQEGILAVAAVPILVNGRIIGCINVASHTKEEIPYMSRFALEAITAQIGSAIVRLKAQAALQESEETHRLLLQTMNEGFGIQDENGFITYVNAKYCKILGYPQDEIIGHHSLEFLDVENRRVYRMQLEKRRRGENKPYEISFTRNDGNKATVIMSPQPIFDEGGHFEGSFAVLTDITALKSAEQKLRKREKDLEMKTSSLEEVNTALKVLLKKREEDKVELEEKVLFNMKELAEPYLEKLNNSGLDERQKAFTDILESHLKDIISPFSRRLASKYLGLTPTEIHVANLVKQGKRTKDMAALLNLSKRTIEVHRRNIRKKLSLNNSKVNLRSYLLSVH